MPDLVVSTPTPFDLDLTVRSHGFYDLPPWSYDPELHLLRRPLALRSGRVVAVDASPARDGVAVRIAADGRLAAAERDEIVGLVRRCLALDEDLAPFHRMLEGAPPARPARTAPDPDLRWAAERGAGRLLRSPTVFEDAVKTLCTTNCTWALTRVMVTNLVQQLGVGGPDGIRCFPAASAMASRDEAFYREAIRAGYRAGALCAISREVASGRLDMERWRDAAVPIEALAEEIRALPGFGPYATEHLLRLVGRYDHLALDSWTRAKLARVRGLRRVPGDAAFRRWYAPFGRFAGLAMWLEATADWHAPTPSWPPPRRAAIAATGARARRRGRR